MEHDDGKKIDSARRVIETTNPYNALLRFVLQSDEVETAGTEICGYVTSKFGLRGAAIYLYERLENRYSLVSFAGHADFPSVLRKSTPEPFMVVPAFRGANNCGYLALDGATEVDMHFLGEFSSLIVILYNRNFITTLLEKASRPIDFFQDESDFYSDICALAMESSQMPAGALRVLNDKHLGTLFSWNNWNLEDGAMSHWDIDLDNSFDTIRRCIEKNAVYVLDEEDLRHPFFRRRNQEGVKSAIFCPMNVGSEVIGVLSFAMPTKYEFSSEEKKGFLSLANSIGVSISNFRRAAETALTLSDDTRVSQILTAVEVAQAARHSARADLDTLKNYVHTISRVIDAEQTKQRRDAIKEALDECNISIDSCFKSLDAIRTAIRPPSRELKYVSLQSLFERAKSQIRGKIIKYKVDARWTDADFKIECYPDHLTQVFLNLILNSIDAFSTARRQNQRRVICRVHDFQSNSDVLTVRFEDSAGGIDVAALRLITGDHDSSVEDLIFTKDVTTKGKNGSGWGLYVTKRIVSDHSGHISLLEYRGKTVFEITLKKRIEK
ncbi:hypothetical protein GVN24_16080 [Rhizobium sp. CRIBSB]|nr:hypothetical protein [Rhizobium sp. CRIBSB]